MWAAVWRKAETSGLSTAIHSANVDNPMGISPSQGFTGRNVVLY